MLDQAGAAATIRDIVLSSWPHRYTRSQLDDDVSLGEDGLGLDSVEIAEILMTCEEHFGTSVTPELFASSPLTIRGLSQFFQGPCVATRNE